MAEKKGKPKSGRAPRANAALSPLKQAFVEEYPKDLNATKAAMRAGYSVHTAHVKAAYLMGDPAVQAAIQRKLEERAKRCEISSDRVLQEIAHIAFADIGDIISVDDHGKVTVRNLEKVSPEARRAIAEIRQTSTEVGNGEESVAEDVKLAIKMNPKVQALKLLVDHLGLNAPVKQEIVVEERSAKEELREKIDGLRKKLRPDEPGGAAGTGSGG